MFFVVGAWALAHHVVRHLGELTDLGGQGAAEAVALQNLGWGAQGTIRGDGIPVIQAVNASDREWGQKTCAAPCDVYLICGICGFRSSGGSPRSTLSLSAARTGAKGGSFVGGEKVDGQAQTHTPIVTQESCHFR